MPVLSSSLLAAADPLAPTSTKKKEERTTSRRSRRRGPGASSELEAPRSFLVSRTLPGPESRPGRWPCPGSVGLRHSGGPGPGAGCASLPAGVGVDTRVCSGTPGPPWLAPRQETSADPVGPLGRPSLWLSQSENFGQGFLYEVVALATQPPPGSVPTRRCRNPDWLEECGARHPPCNTRGQEDPVKNICTTLGKGNAWVITKSCTRQ